VDLKQPAGAETVLRLVAQSDVLIEGFRPGVAERLGIGPQECAARNPKLVYGRMTGWGQFGPLSHAAGHDWNYISITGALHPIGREGEAPVPPLNLVGDFGGGAMFLVCGVIAALLEASKSGRGQVVDAAMVDGAAALMAMFHGYVAMGTWSEERGTNALDTGSISTRCTKPPTPNSSRSVRQNRSLRGARRVRPASLTVAPFRIRWIETSGNR
jgi:alpha-methylacyl-CoA racemase